MRLIARSVAREGPSSLIDKLSHVSEFIGEGSHFVFGHFQRLRRR
jgi:hypothetical protein